jgi:hypothetical protein
MDRMVLGVKINIFGDDGLYGLDDEKYIRIYVDKL